MPLNFDAGDFLQRLQSCLSFPLENWESAQLLIRPSLMLTSCQRIESTENMKGLTFFKSLAATALLIVAVSACSEPAGVDVKQGAAMQSQGALMLDVREPDEYVQGHAPGSTLIPLGQLEKRLSELGAHKNKPIALICRSGNRSGAALKILEKAGFTGAVNVLGGMNAWTKAGLPVVTGTASR
jgi:rhodanese-related sulfurtransferase